MFLLADLQSCCCVRIVQPRMYTVATVGPDNLLYRSLLPYLIVQLSLQSASSLPAYSYRCLEFARSAVKAHDWCGAVL